MMLNDKIENDNWMITIKEELAKLLDTKLEKMQESIGSPYVNGIDGLAKYLGVGLTLAQELKNKKEIAYSQRGRQVWFKKSDIEKFMQRNRA